MVPSQIVQWIKRTYPKPQVDPEWLDGCYTWISTELHLSDVDAVIANVDAQLLQSNLSDSMLHGTGLPSDVSSLDNVHLRGPPILVQIMSITDIGNSAFNLRNVRQMRIDREDLAGLTEQTNEEGEDDGPIPKFPRSMLRFELSDGATTLKAIEYRRIPDLELGVTPLGFKLMLKDVLIRGGIAFLEPRSVILKGHKTEELEVVQDFNFARGLCIRLGQPEPAPKEEQPAAPPPAAELQAAQVLNAVRSPLREVSVPPERIFGLSSQVHNHDDEDQPRRRRIPNSNPVPSSSGSIEQEPSSSNATLVHRSSYFSSASTRVNPSEGFTQLLSPARDDPPPTLAYGTESGPSSTSVLKSDLSSDFGDYDQMDAEFLEQIDQVERNALGASQEPVVHVERPEPVATRRVRQRTLPPRRMMEGIDVIDISD